MQQNRNLHNRDDLVSELGFINPSDMKFREVMISSRSGIPSTQIWDRDTAPSDGAPITPSGLPTESDQHIGYKHSFIRGAAHAYDAVMDGPTIKFRFDRFHDDIKTAQLLSAGQTMDYIQNNTYGIVGDRQLTTKEYGIYIAAQITGGATWAKHFIDDAAEEPDNVSISDALGKANFVISCLEKQHQVTEHFAEDPSVGDRFWKEGYHKDVRIRNSSGQLTWAIQAISGLTEHPPLDELASETTSPKSKIADGVQYLSNSSFIGKFSVSTRFGSSVTADGVYKSIAAASSSLVLDRFYAYETVEYRGTVDVTDGSPVVNYNSGTDFTGLLAGSIVVINGVNYEILTPGTTSITLTENVNLDEDASTGSLIGVPYHVPIAPGSTIKAAVNIQNGIHIADTAVNAGRIFRIRESIGDPDTEDLFTLGVDDHEYNDGGGQYTKRRSFMKVDHLYVERITWHKMPEGTFEFDGDIVASDVMYPLKGNIEAKRNLYAKFGETHSRRFFMNINDYGNFHIGNSWTYPSTEEDAYVTIYRNEGVAEDSPNYAVPPIFVSDQVCIGQRWHKAGDADTWKGVHVFVKDSSPYDGYIVSNYAHIVDGTTTKDLTAEGHVIFGGLIAASSDVEIRSYTTMLASQQITDYRRAGLEFKQKLGPSESYKLHWAFRGQYSATSAGSFLTKMSWFRPSDEGEQAYIAMQLSSEEVDALFDTLNLNKDLNITGKFYGVGGPATFATAALFEQDLSLATGKILSATNIRPTSGPNLYFENPASGTPLAIFKMPIKPENERIILVNKECLHVEGFVAYGTTGAGALKFYNFQLTQGSTEDLVIERGFVHISIQGPATSDQKHILGSFNKEDTTNFLGEAIDEHMHVPASGSPPASVYVYGEGSDTGHRIKIKNNRAAGDVKIIGYAIGF